MRIKKIELIGFKSFADRTEVHLDQGVTCVVGPNGCGKSNISDAIRWVFGERSAKLLRGTCMEDVIFNGTEFRKPMGFAEVSLVMENADRWLPLEYAEVVLTRRLDRSGQSEYFLNRTPCRLRDLLDLILDTGMGSNSYCMMEQGRVDSIINADPQERRFLIEEAAGISKYKVKREEALRKLERTEQNLLRIRDIVNEVQRNIQYAEKQARRAQRYKVQFEELKNLEIAKAFLDLSELDRQKGMEEVRKAERTQFLEKLEAELREVLKKEAEESKLLEKILGEETNQAARSFELRSGLNSLLQKREFNQERLRGYRERQIEIEKERELFTLQLAELEKETAVKTSEHQESMAEHRSVAGALQQEEKRFGETERRYLGEKEMQEKLKSALFETASELVKARNESSHFRTLLETGERGKLRCEETRQKLLNEKQVLEKKRWNLQEEAGRIRREWEGEKSEESRLARDLAQIKDERESLEKQAGEKSVKLQELDSRRRLLEELEENAEETQRKLLASVKGPRLHGKLIRGLREVLQIEAGYESAVEAVLGAFAQGLVAEDIDTAKGLLQEMAAAHSGPCGIFIQSLVKSNGRSVKRQALSHPQVRHSLEEVVRIQAGFEPLFEPLFENVFVVEEFFHESLAELLDLSREAKLVTKEGILLGPEARIFFRNGRLSPDQGPFRRQAEIHDLRNACQVLELELGNLRLKENKLEKEFLHHQEEEKAAEDKKQEALIRREATGSFLRGLEERQAALEVEIRVLEAEIREIEEETARIANRLGGLDQEICELEKREKELLLRQSEIETALSGLQSKREEQIQIRARLKTLLENHEERVRRGEASDSLVRSRIEKAEERLLHLKAERQELSRRTEAVVLEEETLAQRQETLNTDQKEAERILNETRGQKALQDEKRLELLKKSAQFENQLKELREKLHVQELTQMDLSYRGKNITERIEQSYHVRLKELCREDFLKEGSETAALEEEIRLHKEKVESFGPVNLLAVEEHEELKQRYDFLAGQEKDLNEARESLLEAIRKINRTTKTLFNETFMKAQASFQEYYQILFGGGHAELLLLEPEEKNEPQEAGVDILVAPPGKKLQPISLLSGGEKALTAIALLFALFRIKPSPLCVLDEVDAPLDEANIDRFLNVLRTFLDSTQFLIVTHNRKTIALGDFLYGVTMQESGVSKIVSVKVAQSPALAAEKVAAA